MLGRSRRAAGAPEVRAVKTASATATAALATNARRQCTVASSPPISGASESAPVCTLANVPTARVQVLRRHDLGERGEQERRQERIRGALDEARGHEDRERRRRGRDQRADGVGDEARAHDARDAEALADRARDELQSGERDQVGGNRGRHGIARGVEALLQLGHEHAQDGAAEGAHEAPDVERDRGVAGAHGGTTIRAGQRTIAAVAAGPLLVASRASSRYSACWPDGCRLAPACARAAPSTPLLMPQDDL